MTTQSITAIPPPGVPPEAKQIKSGVVDPQAIEEGTLWIYDPTLQKLVSALAEPALFDLLVSQYVTLYDRNEWPLGHRAALLSRHIQIIPTFFLSKVSVQEELLLQLNALKPASTSLSIQAQIEEDVTKEDETT